METEVIELEGTWKEARTQARANLLWTYLNLCKDEKTRFTQKELCEFLALGTDGRALRAATKNLEDRGLLKVNRSVRPHQYELIQEKETE